MFRYMSREGWPGMIGILMLILWIMSPVMGLIITGALITWAIVFYSIKSSGE